MRATPVRAGESTVTRLGWGWGDYWGALCIVVAILAAKMGDLEAWWIPLLLAGVLGYIGLNVLQRQLDLAAERELDAEEVRRGLRPFDQDRDQ